MGSADETNRNVILPSMHVGRHISWYVIYYFTSLFSFFPVALMRYIGGGTGPIFLDRVACSGNEERLIDCRHSEFGVHSCNHRNDAGVFCLPREQTGIYLNVNVSSYNNGISSLTKEDVCTGKYTR